MKKRGSLRDYSCFIWSFLFFVFFSYGDTVYSREEALKVINILQEIERYRAQSRQRSLTQAMITESELNSYIAYRIDVEREQIMKELRFKLLKGNKIEGKVFIDLSGQKIPGFLRPQMIIYFGGRIEVRDGRVKLDLRDLFIEDQRIEPRVVDLIISIASRAKKISTWSINDWFELPYGIKDLEIRRRAAVLFY